MFWSTGLLLALAVSQVPAELAKPEFIENLIGDASDANQRIVSGWPAYPGQHPHQISLRMVNSVGGVSACGGSVVSREWVVTAAHCTAGQITLVVRAGVTSLTTPEYISETQQWHIYPTYMVNLPGLVQPNDISMVKLQRPVTYTRLLQPIRIQSTVQAFHNYENEVVIASGFGRTWTNSATPEDLNWVYLRAVSNPTCQQVYGTSLINANAICAQFYNETSQSTCQGDSGGPLVHVDNNGVPTLVGIASFVAGGDFGCHSGLPAGFIRTGPFLSWMEEVTGIDFENLNEEEDLTTVPTPAPTQTTELVPETTEPAPPQTTELPQTTQTEYVPVPTTVSPTTVRPPKPPTTPEPEEESEKDSSSEEEDPEVSELLKKLIIQVKVKVKINNELKKKVKVKCTDHM